MMIVVDRFLSNGDATASEISVDGKFMCFGLEDEYRKEKIAGETRIPSGQYDIDVRTFGGFHERYKNKRLIKDVHRGMLEICDVPGFTDVLIHIGNTEKDTAGCLLVGKGINTLSSITIQNSTDAYIELYSEVIEAALAGQLSILFLDNDLIWS